MSDLDDLEREAIKQIEDIRRRYEAEIAPVMRRLIDLRNLRPMAPVVIPWDEAPDWLKRNVRDAS